MSEEQGGLPPEVAAPATAAAPWDVPATSELEASAGTPAWAPVSGEPALGGGTGPSATGGTLGGAASAAGMTGEHPEIGAALAFAGGLAAAIILRRLGS